MRGWVTTGQRQREQLAGELVSLLPDVELGIAEVERAAADSPAQASVAQDLTTRWDAFKALWAQGQCGSGPSRGQSAHERGVIASLDALNADANQIAKLENIEGAQRHQTALANERSSRRTMIIALVVGLLASVVWLTRTVLRRILAYSRFAGDLQLRAVVILLVRAALRDLIQCAGEPVDLVCALRPSSRHYIHSSPQSTRCRCSGCRSPRSRGSCSPPRSVYTSPRQRCKRRSRPATRRPQDLDLSRT